MESIETFEIDREVSKVNIKLIHGAIKIYGINNKRIGVRDSFSKWKDCIMKEWLEKYLNIISILNKENISDIILEDDENKSNLQGNLGKIIGCIEQMIKLLLEKNNQQQIEKEKWAINKKRLEQLKELEKINFSNELLERIQFWKKNLFPQIPFENFWMKIESLESNMKLKILETELLNEQNILRSAENTYKLKNMELREKERIALQKEKELISYQKFLEKESIKIQKYWSEIEKFADTLSDQPNWKDSPNLYNKNCQSTSEIKSIFTEESIPEINSSQIKNEESFSDLLKESYKREVPFIEDISQFTLNISTKLKRTAIHTICSKLKYSRYVNINNSFAFWFNLTIDKKKNIQKRNQDKYEVRLVAGDSKNSNILCSSRRQIVYNQNIDYEKEKKFLKKSYSKILKSLVRNWKIKRKAQRNTLFFKWLLNTIKSKKNYKKNTAVIHSPLKIFFLLSIILSRSIADYKKLLAFKTWDFLLTNEKNQMLIEEIDNIELKVNENISREKAQKLEAAIYYEKLKSKLYTLESRMQSL